MEYGPDATSRPVQGTFDITQMGPVANTDWTYYGGGVGSQEILAGTVLPHLPVPIISRSARQTSRISNGQPVHDTAATGIYNPEKPFISHEIWPYSAINATIDQSMRAPTDSDRLEGSRSQYVPWHSPNPREAFASLQISTTSDPLIASTLPGLEQLPVTPVSTTSPSRSGQFGGIPMADVCYPNPSTTSNFGYGEPSRTYLRSVTLRVSQNF
ncbi:hypothetical protein V5O48_011029 [Marasmius crinis-equi]|uniref:Uncharacterized protein n=1 Tax=Marasmius crinis-equi TaxID=585013 RepID=A0ABR3F774_9AGAR